MTRSFTHTRRRFIAGGASLLALPLVSPLGSSVLAQSSSRAARQAHVVVVGGGFAGATAARYLRHSVPDVSITLIEPKRAFVTCPFSNYVIAGFRSMEDITFDYQRFDQERIAVIHGRVMQISDATQHVTLSDGSTVHWDFLILAPGIEFVWDAIRGYGEKISPRAPHAWQAGEQTQLLRRQLQDMDDNGTVVLTAPDNPYRCPPAPYERASVIAHYLTRHKKRAKVVLLDHKNAFTKQQLFQEGWRQLYGNRIEWISGDEGGAITAFDATAMTITTRGAGTFKASVANIVPPQRAPALLRQAQLSGDDGWCPINAYTMQSSLSSNDRIYIIGDAIDPGAMPKSGFAANSQGKACARHIASRLQDTPLTEPLFMNTCYSLLAPDYGISVAGVYRAAPRGITAISGAGGVSPLAASSDFRKKEALYADGWYRAITQEMFI